MNKTLLVTGTVFGILGIILGAFAAHGLEKVLDNEAIDTFETGVRYQMYHAFLLLILGASNFIKEKSKKIVFVLVLFGVVFFSGSIYGLAINSLTAFDFKSIALITPVGGLLLILAWLLLLLAILKIKRD